jgi:hypothetical protein
MKLFRNHGPDNPFCLLCLPASKCIPSSIPLAMHAANNYGCHIVFYRVPASCQF